MNERASVGSEGTIVTGTPFIIEDDRLCITCGFEIRGLPSDGKCPECGTSIEDSLRSGPLFFADPAYLRTIHCGTVIVLVSVGCKIIFPIGAPLIAALANPASGAGAGLVTAITAMFVPWVGSSFGWWLLAAPDPGLKETIRDGRIRRLARALSAVIGVAAAAALPFSFAGGAQASPFGSTAWVAGAALVVGFIVLGVWFFPAMMYLRGLGRRIPNVALRRRAGLMMWVMPLCWAGTMTWPLGQTQLGRTSSAAIVLAPIMGILLLLSVVMYWNALDMLRKDLKRLRRSKAPRNVGRASV